MIKNNVCFNKIKELEKELSSKSIEQTPVKYNNKESSNKLQLKKMQSEKIENKINTASKNDSDKNPLGNIEKLNKIKTFNPQRKDRFGNMIEHGGKQKVTFIDRVTKNNFTEVVKVENFKKYNKMEQPSSNPGYNCCILF